MARAAARLQRPAGPHTARSGEGRPRKIPGGRRRHRDHRFVQRQRHFAQGLRIGGVRPRDFARGGGPRPECGRRIHGPQPPETPVRSRIDGTHQPHRLHLGRRGQSGGPRGDVPPAGRRLHRAGARSSGRRRRCPAYRNGLRHPQRQGGALRGRPTLRGAGPRHSRHALGHVGRRQRPHPLGADRRGFLRFGLARPAALRGLQLRLRSQTDAALLRAAGRRGAVPHFGPSQRRTAQRHGRLRRNTRHVRRGRGRIPPARAGQHRRRLLRHHARTHLLCCRKSWAAPRRAPRPRPDTRPY